LLAELPYRIVIFPSRKSPLTTANLWVSVTGTLGETSQISVPHGFLEFVFHVIFTNKNFKFEIDSLFSIFQHKNLGLLTSMRVGHDNFGASSKFLIEHIVARNEVTGHTFK